MRKRHAVSALAAALALFCSACAGAPAERTYWLKNSTTGTYSAHRVFAELSPEEISDLGLVTKLPEGAKTTD